MACFWAGYSFFASCSPDSGIGSNILPDNNTLNANFNDTTTLRTSLVLEDSVITNGVNAFFLGSYNDPIFGETKASIYAQVTPAVNGANPFTVVGTFYNGTTGVPATRVILDSVVFSIPYVFTTPNYYGVLSPQTVQVYSLDKQMYPDTSYYSSTVIPHSTLLGERIVTPNITEWDSTRYSNTRIEPCPIYNYPRFKVRLNQQWGQKWVDTALSGVINITGRGDSILLNQAFFIHDFPGIYITTNSPMQFPGQGSLWFMNLYDAGAGVFFYMKIINSNGTTTDTTYSIPQLGMSSEHIAFSHFDHNYKTTSFYAPHKVGTPINSQLSTYVQGFGGVTTKINMPYIMNWVKNNKVIVNRAELDIPVQTQDIGIYAPPAQMYLIGINDTSTVPTTATFTLPDEYTTYYGGTYDEFNHEYTFDIAEYIQNVFDKKTIEDGLYLLGGSSAISPSRVVLYGGGTQGAASNKKMRLKIYYTPLNSHKVEKPKVMEFPVEAKDAPSVKAIKH